MKIFDLKRVMSICVMVAIISGTLSCIGITTVAAATYERTNPATFSSVSESWNENYLYGVKPDVKKSDGSVLSAFTSGGSLPESNITDGTSAVALYEADAGTTLTFDMGKEVTINRFYMFTWNNRSIKSYELYVANSLSSLYSDSNRILEGSNKNGYTSVHESYKFTAGFPKGRYLGIKILITGVGTGYDNYTGISEIAAFGAEDKGYVYNCTNPSSFSDFGVDWTQSLLCGITPEVKDNSGKKVGAFTDWGQSASNITDTTNLPALWKLDNGSTLTFELNNSAVIDKICTASINNYSVKRYEVYVSEKLEDLYDDQKKVYTGTNLSGANSINELITFTGTEKPSGKFIGFRIIQVGYSYSGNPYTGFREIAVFGDSENDSYNCVKSNPTPFSSINENWSQNLLYNKTPISAKLPDGKDMQAFTEWGHPVSNITDGTTAPSLWKATNDSYIAFDIGFTCKIDRIYMFTATNYSIKSYDIYVSEDKDKLFDSKSYILSGSNLNGTMPCNERDVFTGTKKPTGRYIGIKIKETGYTYSSNPYTAVGEFAVFGEASVPEHSVQTGVNVTSLPTKKIYQIGESLDIKGMSVSADYNGIPVLLKEGDYAISGFDSSSAGTKKVTITNNGFKDEFTIRVVAWNFSTTSFTSFSSVDKDWTKSLTYKKMPDTRHSDGTQLLPNTSWGYAATNITDGTTNFSMWRAQNGDTLTFDLEAVYCVDEIYMVTKPEYAIKDFEIYISDKKATLYNDINFAGEGHNIINGNAIHQKISYTGNKPTGRFVGIKIVTVGYSYADNPYSIITEFGVFGEKKSDADMSFKLIAQDSEITQDYVDSLGENLLANKKFSVVGKTGTGLKTVASTNVPGIYNGKALTDGSISAGDNGSDLVRVYFENTSEFPCKITYDMRQGVNIDKILVYGHNSKSVNYQLSAYKIYLSNNKADLYEEKNLVIDRSNIGTWMKDAESSEIAGIAQVYQSNGKVCDRYIGITVEAPNSGISYADVRMILREIGVYGTLDPGEPTNLLANTIMNAYQNNQKLSSEKFTDEMRHIITDNISSADNGIQIGTDFPLDFVFDLGGGKTIDSFLLGCGSDDMSSLICGFKVYAAQTEDEIWSENSLIYTYSRSSQDTQSIIRYQLPETSSYQYIRFCITKGGIDGSCKLSEISAIGYSWQKNEMENILYQASNSDIIAFIENNETKTIFETDTFADRNNNQKGDLTSALTDDERGGTNVSLYGAKPDTETLNLQIDLQDTCLIRNITVSGISHQSLYNSSKMALYISNSTEELWGSEAKAISVGTDSSRSGTLNFDFSETQGRYLRLSVLEGADQSVCIGSQLAVLSEITVDGVRYNTGIDSTNMPSFVDSNTGIKVDILPLSYRDVYSNVKSMQIIKKDPNVEQKKYLNKFNLIVYNDACYEIRLFDAYGNVVNDLGGRSLKISFPVDSTLENKLIYVGKVLQNKVIAKTAEYSPGYVVFIADDNTGDMNFAILTSGKYLDLTNSSNNGLNGNVYETPSTNTPTDTVENIPNDNDEQQDASRTSKRIVKRIVTKVVDLTWLWITITVVSVTGIGVAVFVVIRKRKKSQSKN